MSSHSAIRRVAALGVAITTVLGLSAPSAQAKVIDEDRVYLDTAHVDFGGADGHAWGRPKDSAAVRWGDGTEDTWVRGHGTLYLDEAWLGGCAVLRWKLRAGVDGEVIDADIEQFCRYGPAPYPTLGIVNLSSDDRRITVAEFCVQFIDVWGTPSELTCEINKRTSPRSLLPFVPTWPPF